jgi:hypothetical protein
MRLNSSVSAELLLPLGMSCGIDCASIHTRLIPLPFFDLRKSWRALSWTPSGSG